MQTPRAALSQAPCQTVPRLVPHRTQDDLFFFFEVVFAQVAASFTKPVSNFTKLVSSFTKLVSSFTKLVSIHKTSFLEPETLYFIVFLKRRKFNKTRFQVSRNSFQVSRNSFQVSRNSLQISRNSFSNFMKLVSSFTKIVLTILENP